MDRQYLELFKQLIRLKTTHAPENLSDMIAAAIC
jgi:hypothetical protein